MFDCVCSFLDRVGVVKQTDYMPTEQVIFAVSLIALPCRQYFDTSVFRRQEGLQYNTVQYYKKVLSC